MCQALAGNFLAGLHSTRQRAASCSSKMISFSNINKQYGKQLLFVDASFQLNPGERVGLVGPNGSGKTTLFRMVVGKETPDEGAVSVPKKLTIGYFRQDVEEMQAVRFWMKRSQVADASATCTTSSKPCCGKCPTLRRLMISIAFLDHFGSPIEKLIPNQSVLSLTARTWAVKNCM
jgi:translation initiation factor RLI1